MKRYLLYWLLAAALVVAGLALVAGLSLAIVKNGWEWQFALAWAALLLLGTISLLAHVLSTRSPK